MGFTDALMIDWKWTSGEEIEFSNSKITDLYGPEPNNHGGNEDYGFNGMTTPVGLQI